MSDYMRGYDNRNRRRRAAYSSSGRSAYKRRQKNRRGRSRLFFYLTRGGVIVAAILLVAFGVRAALGLVGEAGDSKEPAKTAGSAVTGAAVSASAVTPVPGGVAEAAAKVPEISCRSRRRHRVPKRWHLLLTMAQVPCILIRFWMCWKRTMPMLLSSW